MWRKRSGRIGACQQFVQDNMNTSEPLLGIAAVEREVGLSKDVLRVWERRYGFPAPLRDRNDERLYPADQVERLRMLKRLMDQGHRPGRLLARSADELQELASASAATSRSAQPSGAGDDSADALLRSLRSHDAEGLARLLRQHLVRQGLNCFVQDIVAPMAVRVGEAWADGRLQVFEEHLFTETVSRVLRHGIASFPPGLAPTVLLTTAPDESHALGLLMVESMLALHGARCVCLGTGTPVAAIARAAQVYKADVVALSFSSAFPARAVPPLLRQLRDALASGVEVWAGGAAVRRLQPVEAVQLLPELDDAVKALDAWRQDHGGSSDVPGASPLAGGPA